MPQLQANAVDSHLKALEFSDSGHRVHLGAQEIQSEKPRVGWSGYTLRPSDRQCANTSRVSKLSMNV